MGTGDRSRTPSSGTRSTTLTRAPTPTTRATGSSGRTARRRIFPAPSKASTARLARRRHAARAREGVRPALHGTRQDAGRDWRRDDLAFGPRPLLLLPRLHRQELHGVAREHDGHWAVEGSLRHEGPWRTRHEHSAGPNEQELLWLPAPGKPRRMEGHCGRIREGSVHRGDGRSVESEDEGAGPYQSGHIQKL